MDVDVNDAESLFRLLDIDETGTLSPQELVDGWIRLRGPAKALDLAVLMHDCNRMDAKLDWLCEVTQSPPMEPKQRQGPLVRSLQFSKVFRSWLQPGRAPVVILRCSGLY